MRLAVLMIRLAPTSCGLSDRNPVYFASVRTSVAFYLKLHLYQLSNRSVQVLFETYGTISIQFDDVNFLYSNYFASDDCGNSSPSHGQTDTDTVGSTVSGISHGHTAHAPASGPTFSATSLAPSLKKINKKILVDFRFKERLK